MRIYMDHNATTPCDPRVREVVCSALDVAGNPSSIHREGREARDLVERARAHVADLIAAQPEAIVFTSGGTEADCLGIIGLARLAMARGQEPIVLSTRIEHPAVMGALAHLAEAGVAIQHVAVDSQGRVCLDDLERILDRVLDRVQGQTAARIIVALSLANHEVGTIQDLQALSALIRARGGQSEPWIHCDAVQAAGKMPIDVAHLGVDTLAISGHKIHGPRGVGALYVREGLTLPPLIPAGHQERERRPGTENVAGIAGLGEAARLARERGPDESQRIAALTTELEAGLERIQGARIHARDARRIGNTINVAFEGALGEVVVAALDMHGFAVSTGAACTSGSVEPSSVLLGVGLSEARAREAVRISLGRANTAAHIRSLLDVLPDIIQRARHFR